MVKIFTKIQMRNMYVENRIQSGRLCILNTQLFITPSCLKGNLVYKQRTAPIKKMNRPI